LRDSNEALTDQWYKNGALIAVTPTNGANTKTLTILGLRVSATPGPKIQVKVSSAAEGESDVFTES